VAKARAIKDIEEDDAYGVAAAKVIEVRTRELVKHSDGVLDISDIERLHDMRVATRRLRAALEVFEACFPAKPFGAVLKDVKALADALGERRDRDVHIASLAEFSLAVGPQDKLGVESLIGRLGEEQRDANRALEPYVSEQRVAALAERLDELAAAAREAAAA
jgi:CHAD domain-containing protein